VQQPGPRALECRRCSKRKQQGRETDWRRGAPRGLRRRPARDRVARRRAGTKTAVCRIDYPRALAPHRWPKAPSSIRKVPPSHPNLLQSSGPIRPAAARSSAGSRRSRRVMACTPGAFAPRRAMPASGATSAPTRRMGAA
jgi:hypothetical protein